MSIKSGFYNSINHDRRYGVADFGELFDGLISEGVYANIGRVFNITVASEPGTVSVDVGRAWLGKTWTYNDAPTIVQLSEASTYGDRWDAVCIEVNSRDRENRLAVVQGTPGSGYPAINAGLPAGVQRWALAYILRPKSDGTNALLITNANIHMVVGTEETPFVTSLIQTVAVDALLEKWQTEAESKLDGVDEAVREIFAREVPAGYLSKKFTTTVSSSIWASYSDGGVEVFRAEKALAGILETDDPIIDLDLSETAGEDAQSALEGWGYVYKVVTTNGQLTLYATDKPEVDLPLKLQSVRK